MEESECFSLIDENDSLISTDAADDDASLTHPHSGDLGGDRVEGTYLSNKCGQQLPQLFKTAEPEIPRKTGKLNLRKSLAWDSAFFESPGFLDAEELSTMINGAEKGKRQLLPGIDEDISRSTESISTLASENLALESLEDELFKDIRASIQKSSKRSSISTSDCKEAPNEIDKLVKRSVKKVDITSGNGIARDVSSKRQTGGMQGSGRISKKDSSSALVTQPGLRNGKSSSSLPQPPKVITKPEAMPAVTTKRGFLGANPIKTRTNNSKVGGKGVQVHVPMTAGLAGPQRSVTEPASLPKTSGSASSGATIKEVGRSSCSSNGSKSTYTENIQKPTSTRTKKISRPVIQASSKIHVSKKLPGKSGLPSSLTSTKISSSISSSSSISEWSSASSSTSTVNRRLTSRISIDNDTNSSPSILCSDVQSNDSISDGILNQFKESPSQDMKKINAQNNVLSRSVLVKPSGLRMPSPKIGFFDGAKSMVHTPNACRQSQLRLPTGLPKIGAAIRSPVGSLKKAEGNIPSGKKAISAAKTVLNTSKSASPRPLQESSRASMKGHGDSRSVLNPNNFSEVRSLNKGTGKPWCEMTLTITKIELEGKKSDSPKAFQESISPDRSPEQSQSHLPTGLPKIRAAIHSPFGSSKKTEENILAGKKATASANTVLDTSKSAAPKPSQESSRASMKGHADRRSVSSPDISSESRSSNEGTGKPWSKMTLTSTNNKLEGQTSGSIKPFQESASVGLSPEQSQSCLPTGLPEIEASVCNAITLLNISNSDSTTASQESLRVLMKCHGGTESVLSPNISSEMRSLNKETAKPWPEMTLSSTNIELEGHKSDSPKPFQEGTCPGVSQEQSQSPTCLPKIGAAIHSPVGSSKEAKGYILAGENISGANTVLDMSESATPKPSEESSRDSMKSHGDHRSLLSPDISFEATSLDGVTRKPCSGLTLISTNIELEGQKPNSPKPFQESASVGLSPEQSQSCLPTGLSEIEASVCNAITLLNISNSDSPTASQESSRVLMKCQGGTESVLSPNISSEMRSLNKETAKPWPEMTLTSTNIELEGHKSDSPKPFQEGTCPGVSQEQSQSPTCLPKIGAAIHSPVGSSKEAKGYIPAEENISGANTVLDMSESATPKPSEESSRDSMKSHGDHRNLLSPDIFFEATSLDGVTRKPCSGLTLISTNIELEGQKPNSPKPFQESASVGLSPEQSQSCLPTGLSEIEASVCNAITLLNISNSDSPTASQESSRVLMKCQGGTESVLSPNISSEMRSLNKETAKPWPEMTLTSTNIELEGHKSDSPKPFQEGTCPGVSQEQSQSPTCLSKIGAAIHSPVGSSKEAKGYIPAGENISGANTVLDMSESATPKPSEESSRDSMKSHGDHRSLLSPDISFEATSSDGVTRKPCSGLTLISTNIELEGQKPNSPKPFQESASFGMSRENQPCLATDLPTIGAAIYNTVGSSKKEEKFPAGEKATAGANTVLDTSKSASPKPSQESLGASMKGHGDPWKLSPNLSSEARSSNMGSGKSWSEITLTSTHIELEGQKSDFPKPFRESASPGMSPDVLSIIDRSNCGKAEDMKIGKRDGAERATANAPEVENNENLLLNI